MSRHTAELARAAAFLPSRGSGLHRLSTGNEGILVVVVLILLAGNTQSLQGADLHVRDACGRVEMIHTSRARTRAWGCLRPQRRQYVHDVRSLYVKQLTEGLQRCRKAQFQSRWVDRFDQAVQHPKFYVPDACRCLSARSRKAERRRSASPRFRLGVGSSVRCSVGHLCEPHCSCARGGADRAKALSGSGW